MTLDLVLLLLDENIYDENQSVKILWFSYSYEFTLKRSKTRSGVKALRKFCQTRSDDSKGANTRPLTKCEVTL